MQIGCEEAALARLLVPLKTSWWRPGGTLWVVEKTVVSISAYLIVLQNQELVALIRCSPLLCHPGLRCVVWFGKTLHSVGFLCRWSFSSRVRQRKVEQQCYPC